MRDERSWLAAAGRQPGLLRPMSVKLLTVVQDEEDLWSCPQGIRPLTPGSAPCERDGVQIFGRHRPVTPADRTRLADQLAEIGMAIGVGEPACCCPARPVVRVVLPATATRPEPIDLLLCGHHYRDGQRALRAAGAVVYDKQGAVIMDAVGQRLSRPHQNAVVA